MILLVLYILFGIITAEAFLKEQRAVVRYWLGTVFGMVVLMWLPCLFAFFTGFTMTAELLAAGVVIMASVPMIIKILKRRAYEKTLLPAEEEREKIRWTSDRIGIVLSLIFTALCAYLLYTHVLRQASDGSLHVGQSTFGDLSMHLGMIENLFVTGKFPPDYNIFPGNAINYPFLVNALSSSLRFFGCSLKMSVILPSIVMLYCVFQGFYLLAEKLTKKIRPAVFATLLFFLNGGFGFIYFVDFTRKTPGNFTRIFSAFYNTPTNYTDDGNIRWVNSICDMLIPQRTTMAGWCVLLAALYLLITAIEGVLEEDKTTSGVGRYKYFISVGLIAGAMPMIHTHSFMALGIVTAVWFFTMLPEILKKKSFFTWFNGFALYGAAALILGAPQLFKWTFAQAGDSGFVKFHFDWINADDNWLWFWVKNCGIVFMLILPAIMNMKSQSRRMYAGPLAIFVLATFFVFQPNYYDNNKLFFVWYMFTAIYVAEYMIAIYDSMKGVKGLRIIAAAVIFLCVFSGVLTIIREAVSDYQLESAAQVEAAEWVKENTEKDAVFVTADQHNHPISVLTGRYIFCGSGTFLYFHGIDINERRNMLMDMYTNGESIEIYKESYDIDYIYIGSTEKYNYDTDYDYLDANYELVFENSEARIYKIK